MTELEKQLLKAFIELAEESRRQFDSLREQVKELHEAYKRMSLKLGERRSMRFGD